MRKRKLEPRTLEEDKIREFTSSVFSGYKRKGKVASVPTVVGNL